LACARRRAELAAVDRGPEVFTRLKSPASCVPGLPVVMAFDRCGSDEGSELLARPLAVDCADERIRYAFVDPGRGLGFPRSGGRDKWARGRLRDMLDSDALPVNLERGRLTA